MNFPEYGSGSEDGADSRSTLKSAALIFHRSGAAAFAKNITVRKQI